MSSGTGTIVVRDGEGTEFSVTVTVGTGVSTTPKIRYIRDTANGSSSNEGTHWVEVQALDANGVNKALGKPVTGLKAEVSYQPYSNITDGNLAAANYTEGGVGKNTVTVDLGSLFDIKTVKVWHYF